MQGIDIEAHCRADRSRVALWMGHRQMIELYGEAEPPLPLDSPRRRPAATTRCGPPWPDTDCIIGNPPFLGASHVRGALGDEFVNWIKREFDVGVKDLCAYWFRRAQDHLQPGQRAGLVGTNSISQNLGRSASLDYVVHSGGVITDAVSSQKWPGEAKVHVSLVAWTNRPNSPIPLFTLDGISVSGITPELRSIERSTGAVAKLTANTNRCFEGPSPKAAGMIISAEEASALLSSGDLYRDVVRPYLTAADIADDPAQRPSRWVIDFGLRRLEEAQRYDTALAIVRERVKPEREKNNRKSYRDKWWIFAEPRTAMRAALGGRPRFAVTAGHAKRLILSWCDPWTLPSNATDVFAFDDDYSMGAAPIPSARCLGLVAILDTRNTTPLHTDVSVRDLPVARSRPRLTSGETWPTCAGGCWPGDQRSARQSRSG